VEAEDAAEAALGFGAQKGRWVEFLVGRLDVGEERGEVVVEGEDAGVSGIVDSAGADVAGTEVAGGVVCDGGGSGGGGGFTLPGALGALGGYEDPLAEERIVAAVRD
jgi:hypothetical protein